MSKGMIVLIVVVLALIIIVGWVVGIYNTMVTQQRDVENAWAQVETQYQRRADLIPRLVETVKGFAGQELNVFTEVTQLRSQWAAADTQQEQVETTNELEGALSRLLLVSENYPELKSNENFLALQDELAGTENRVSVERKRYNDAVTTFNKTISIWPNNMFANMFGFSEETLFEATTGAEVAPEVDFNTSPVPAE